MSKDPAFLFYSADFLVGTMFFSDEQVGKYIKLLCTQHQKGPLTEKDMLNICKTYDKDIFAKFEKDGKLYFNQRLSEEIEKRKKYSESRRQNRLKKAKKADNDNICKTYDKDSDNISSTYDKHMLNTSKSYEKHMENENENENENINSIYKGVEEKIFPFESENFLSAWNDWKTYLIKEKRIRLNGLREQEQLSHLGRTSMNDESAAIEMIRQAIRKGWKDIYPIQKDDTTEKKLQDEWNRRVMSDPNI